MSGGSIPGQSTRRRFGRMRARLDVRDGFDALLLGFSSFTACYWVVLAGGLPALASIGLFLPVSAAAGLAWFRRPRGAGEGPLPRGLSLLGLLLAALTLFCNRPDADDLLFLHRAIRQLSMPMLPFAPQDGVMSADAVFVSSLPHLLTSYEVGLAFLGRACGLDPVWVCQHLGAVVAALAMPAAYYRLFRALGLERRESAGAAALAMAFLLSDGNQHASFGNFAFVRLWQGKAIFLSLVLPWMLTELLHLSEGVPRAGWRLALLLVSGVGLTGSALFLAPLLIGLFGLASINEARQRHASRALWRRLALAAALALPPVVLLGALSLDVVPLLQHYPVQREWFFQEFSAEDWIAPLEEVLGGPEHWIWYGFLLFVPAVVLRHRTRALVIVHGSLLSAAILTNPWAGPLWLDQLVTVYWRLLFLFPVAVGAGLTAASISDALDRRGRARFVSALSACTIGALCVVHFERSTLSPDNRTGWKLPLEARFLPVPRHFSERLAARIADEIVLAPESIVEVLPLLRPTSRFVSTRAFLTLEAFHEAGRPAEGRRRVAAMQFTAAGPDTAAASAAFRWAVAGGARLVVLQRDRETSVADQLRALGHRWAVLEEDPEFAAWRVD